MSLLWGHGRAGIHPSRDEAVDIHQTPSILKWQASKATRTSTNSHLVVLELFDSYVLQKIVSFKF